LCRPLVAEVAMYATARRPQLFHRSGAKVVWLEVPAEFSRHVLDFR